MTADDEVLIGFFRDGLPHPTKRAASALPHRSPKGLSVRVAALRKRGLIKPSLRGRIPGLDDPTPASDGTPPPRPPRAVEEHPLRCPGCMKVFFPSDALPMRATA